MYNFMNKIVFSILFIFALILMPGAGESFVPQAPHLLHLVIEKIKQPVGIEAYQTKTVLNHSGVLREFDDIEEKLIYVFPNQFRAQIISETQSGFTVESDFQFIKVMNGQVVSVEKSPIDLYTDILLYRDHESLLKQLVLAGIDTQTVTFQRYNDLICYVIGRPTAGLWIDKETLFPIKYVIEKKGWAVEFIYGNWQRISKTWYPMTGSVLLDNQLFATINVKNFELKSQKSSSLFNFDQIKLMYPGNEVESSSDKASQVDELDKGIENFKNLYE